MFSFVFCLVFFAGATLMDWAGFRKSLKQPAYRIVYILLGLATLILLPALFIN